MQKPKILQSALASISGELRKVRTEYENTLAEIGKRKDEIKRLLDMPVNLDDFGEYLKKSIRIEGEKYLAETGRELLEAPRGENGGVNTWSLHTLDNKPLYDKQAINGLWMRHWLLDGIYTNVSALNDFRNEHYIFRRMICCFMPDTVYNTMMAAIKAQIGDKWGNADLPTVAERRETIATLEAELAELEAKRAELAAQLAEFGQIAAVNAELGEIQQMAATEQTA